MVRGLMRVLAIDTALEACAAGVFAAFCLFMMYSAVVYKPWVALAALALLPLGLPVYWLGSWKRGGR